MFHGYRHDDVHDPRMEQGFLGMLRPYRGLREENFHSVMTCLRALAGSLQGESVDQAVIGALWGICHLGRAWGVWPDGMLRRNNLITPDDATRLEEWIDQISYSTFYILDRGDVDDAFEHYVPPQPSA
ncbi:hypothetical protein BJF90_19095 [Pseudonocardia sp. CNS-004]|nr:hypothetical protein BJF90_19095 [Pseudonocardia sp. CNS-004]